MIKYIECECKYCQKNSYLWKINKNELWVEIPKNASTTIKVIHNIRDRTAVSVNKKEIINKVIHTGEIVRAWAILRDPIDRFKSLLSHFFLAGGRHHVGKKWLESIRGDSPYYTPKLQHLNESNVCDAVLANMLFLNKIDEPHHFNTQKSFIPDILFDLKIINFYDMKWARKQWPTINSSKPNEIYISAKNEHIIRHLYADDFKLYNQYIKKEKI
tara:strand:- start:1116 stop:1760 length:645 start_codon:yes stop_codon:yes gene_type:complete